MRKKIYGIIPARKGSVRLPNKNMMDFCGQPLLYHTLHFALKSECFDEVVLTTDYKISEECNKIASIYETSFRFHQRPQKLCGNEIDPGLVALECMSGYPLEESLLVLLQPTSSLRTFKIMMDIFVFYLTFEDPVISVNPQYQPNGMFFMCTLKDLYENYSFHCKESRYYKIPSRNSVDIDKLSQFRIAEQIYRELQREGEL